MGRRPRGHISTYLVPWLAAGAIAGVLLAAWLRQDGGVYAAFGAAAGFAAFVLCHVAAGWIEDRRERRHSARGPDDPA